MVVFVGGSTGPAGAVHAMLAAHKARTSILPESTIASGSLSCALAGKAAVVLVL